MLPLGLALLGCESLGFYGQAVSGQLGLMRERTPLEPLMAELAQDEDPTNAALLARLRESQAVLEFAVMRDRSSAASRRANSSWATFLSSRRATTL